MDKPEFLVELGPVATDEAFAIGMAKLLEREGRTIAAAEMRRLSAENKLLHERHHDDNVEYTRVLAQRDALLEALKQSLEEAIYPSKMLSDVYEKARAAIKAVEEGK